MIIKRSQSDNQQNTQQQQSAAAAPVNTNTGSNPAVQNPAEPENFSFEDIVFDARQERRQGSRRRGYRRIDERNIVSRAQEEANSVCPSTDGGDTPYYMFLLGLTYAGDTEAWFIGGDGTAAKLPIPADVEPGGVYYESDSLLLVFSYGREEGETYTNWAYTLLIPTGELFESVSVW